MPAPDYKSVFADPASHVDFITVADDGAFEGQHLDRKQASRPDPHGRLLRGDFDKLKELIESTMSAFANADGGVLVLGVTTEGDVAGLNHLSESQINSLLNLKSMAGAVMTSKLHSIIVGEDTQRIALFKVDAPERSICYRIKDDAVWIRKGTSTQRLRGPELEQLRRDRRVVDFEMTPSERFQVEDVDTGVLAEFVKSHDVIDDDRDTVQILRNAGAISVDPVSPNWTHAGLLFFAYNPRRVLAQAYIRLLRFDCPYADEDERPTPSFEKDFDGPLTKQIRDFRVFVRESGFFKTYQVRAPGGGFANEPEYPAIAVDEAVVNAVAHRDHGVPQPITCEKYEDAFLVKSPGLLRQPFQVPSAFRLNERQLESFPRNRRIMDWLRSMKDATGTPYVKAVREGTRRMRDEMQKLRLPSPLYRLRDVETVVVLRNDSDRRGAKPTGLAAESEIISNEFTNLFRLTGLDAKPTAGRENEQRGRLLIALVNKMEANGWVIDVLAKGRAVVHLKGAQEPLPARLKDTLRIIPAYALHVRSYHGRLYLIADYKALVQSILTAQQVVTEFGPTALKGLKAFARIGRGLARGRVLSATTDHVTLRLFESANEESVSAGQVYPNLRREQVDAVVHSRAPDFDLPKAIRKAALATAPGSARVRSERIHEAVRTIATTVFPLRVGNSEVNLETTPLRLIENGDGKRAWRVETIDEPDVEFRRHHVTADIRSGITTFGAFADEPRDIEIVAVVQPGYEQKLRALVARLQSGAFKYRGSERTFSTRLRLAHVFVGQGIGVDEECRRLVTEYGEWAGNERLDRIVLVHTPEAGYSLDDVSSPYFGAKRVLLESGIPCQMLDTPTLVDPDWKDLNLALNVVAKVGVRPWVLPESIPDADFFIGLSYTSSRQEAGDRLLGFANVFNEYGRWEFYSGGNTAVPYQEREVHYENLVAATMGKLSLQERPTVYFHYSARYSRADRDAILRGAQRIRPRGVYVFVWVNSHHPVRLFDERAETDGSAARGRYAIAAGNQIYLSTTGNNPFRTALGTPQALEVNVYASRDVRAQGIDHRVLARQILSLTKLNWASTDALCADPITIKYAKDIAYLTEAFQRQGAGEFALHPVLERTPWFI
ncbi:MAG: putative DNA binding domain-containing protein [Gammaproteobacteria bacterium]|nr:putative DNA binding domain-containing protein [Gammaproteobacteria bacterium]